MNLSLPDPAHCRAVVSSLTAEGEGTFMFAYHDGHPSLLGTGLIREYNSFPRVVSLLKSDVPRIDYWGRDGNELASIQVDYNPGELQNQLVNEGVITYWKGSVDLKGTFYAQDLETLKKKLIDGWIPLGIADYVYFFTGTKWMFVRAVYDDAEVVELNKFTHITHCRFESDSVGNYVWRDLEEHLLSGELG